MGELVIIVNHTKKEYIDPSCKIGELKEDLMKYLIMLLRLPWADCRIQVIGENQNEYWEITNYGQYKLIKGEEE